MRPHSVDPGRGTRRTAGWSRLPRRMPSRGNMPRLTPGYGSTGEWPRFAAIRRCWSSVGLPKLTSAEIDGLWLRSAVCRDSGTCAHCAVTGSAGEILGGLCGARACPVRRFSGGPPVSRTAESTSCRVVQLDACTVRGRTLSGAV